jgi:hypothetical protein
MAEELAEAPPVALDLTGEQETDQSSPMTTSQRLRITARAIE